MANAKNELPYLPEVATLLARNENPPDLLEVYTVTQKLGEGSFGVVYLVKHKKTREVFAAKLIDKVEATKENITLEVEVHRRLVHPRIVRFQELCSTKVFTCVVMQLCRGGDLINGMMRHWTAKGMISIGVVRALTSQMWEAIGYLHSLRCVHRDVKGDNFMMDDPDVGSPNNAIYLSDFGTAMLLREGERLAEKCGTGQYWSPEFVKRNYGIKVDCWAVGVLMYGLFSGKFPFSKSEDILHKDLKVPPRAVDDGKDFLVAALDKNESTRIEARDALNHKFIADVVEMPGSPVHWDVSGLGQIHEVGANAGIRERRRELVERMQAAHLQSSPQRGRAHSTTEGLLIEDPASERTTRFQWWKAADAAPLLTSFESAPLMPAGFEDGEVTAQGIRKLLTDHGVSMEHFGKGRAKSFEDFVDEIRSGQSRLLLDATQHKRLVRVVDVVLLSISYGPECEEQYLLETSEMLPDGRKRENTDQLPGNKKAPHENTVQTAERLCRDMLAMGDCGIEFFFSDIDDIEDEEESPSYPGMRTVYKKELIRGKVRTKDAAVLRRVGALGAEGKGFAIRDSQSYTRTYAWLSASECSAKGLRLRFPTERGDISALVYPPIGLDEQEVQRFLEQSKIDVSVWGNGTHKSVTEFSEELVKGEAALLQQADGKLLRVVDIVVLKIVDNTGKILVEVEETFKDSKQSRQRLPAIKRRSDEHQFLAARRLITRFLRLSDFSVILDPNDVRIIDEQQESTSYFGLPTLYRKRFMTARLLTSE